MQGGDVLAEGEAHYCVEGEGAEGIEEIDGGLGCVDFGDGGCELGCLWPVSGCLGGFEG